MCKECGDVNHVHKEIDLSVVIPIYKEGEEIGTVLDELIGELDKTQRSWEIIMIDNDVKGNSVRVLREYADKYENFHVVVMTHPGIAVTDKNKKYILGHQLAEGKYIITMDGDGQDDPHELPKFLEKLDNGADFVIGYKAKRKDGFFYVLSSRVANGIIRMITGVKLHDMNNGFKAYKATVAKDLKLRGGMFRFIPTLLNATKKNIAEVPVNHRKRMYEDPKFNFMSRLKGGLFDMLTTVALSRMQQTPMYFFGPLALLCIFIGTLFIVGSLFIADLVGALLLGGFGLALFVMAFTSVIAGLILSYQLWQTPLDEYDFGLIEIYSGKEEK